MSLRIWLVGVFRPCCHIVTAFMVSHLHCDRLVILWYPNCDLMWMEPTISLYVLRKQSIVFISSSTTYVEQDISVINFTKYCYQGICKGAQSIHKMKCVHHDKNWYIIVESTGRPKIYPCNKVWYKCYCVRCTYQNKYHKQPYITFLFSFHNRPLLTALFMDVFMIIDGNHRLMLIINTILYTPFNFDVGKQ